MNDRPKPIQDFDDLQPGDVLRCEKAGKGSNLFTPGRFYAVNGPGYVTNNHGGAEEYSVSTFTRVARVGEEWTPENNATVYGELTPGQLKRLKAAKHGWQYCSPGGWADTSDPRWVQGIAYRAKPAPASCEGREVEIDGVIYVLRPRHEP